MHCIVLWLLLPFKNIMEPITIQEVWQLLQPSRTYNTRGRYEKCLFDWASMNDAQQRRVYALLQAKKDQAGLNPNPCFALNDAMQEYEQQQAKANRQRQILSYADYYARYGTTEETDITETIEKIATETTKTPATKEIIRTNRNAFFQKMNRQMKTCLKSKSRSWNVHTATSRLKILKAHCQTEVPTRQFTLTAFFKNWQKKKNFCRMKKSPTSDRENSA